MSNREGLNDPAAPETEAQGALREYRDLIRKLHGEEVLARIEVGAQKIIAPFLQQGDSGTVFLSYLTFKLVAHIESL